MALVLIIAAIGTCAITALRLIEYRRYARLRHERRKSQHKRITS